MKRRAQALLAFALAALAVSAHAEGGRWGERGHDQGRGSGGRYEQRGDNRGRGDAGQSRSAYEGSRGRGYVAPAPYEPPVAPYYEARPNSLGAQWGQQQDEARRDVRQGRIMPLSRVVQNLSRLRPGRVLDAGLEAGPNGRAAYRVRWAASGGRRIDFIVDAETGAIIGQAK